MPLRESSSRLKGLSFDNPDGVLDRASLDGTRAGEFPFMLLVDAVARGRRELECSGDNFGVGGLLSTSGSKDCNKSHIWAASSCPAVNAIYSQNN